MQSSSFAMPSEQPNYGTPGNGNPTTGIGGPSTPFYTAEIDLLPGMSADDPSADYGPNPSTGMQASTRKTANFPMANENIDRKFIVLPKDDDFGVMAARSLRPGQLVFCQRGPSAIDSQLPRAIFPASLQAMNWELATNAAAYPDVASVVRKWNLLGQLKIDNVSEGKRDGLYNPGRLLGVTMWGETHTLDNVFGNDVHQGTKLFVILKKVRVQDKQFDSVNPLGQFTKRYRPDNPLVFQFVPWSSAEHDYPRLIDQEWVENGVTKYGKPYNFAVSDSDETMTSDADLNRAARDGTLGVPRLRATIYNRVF
jgi:hypothetical protein